MKAKLFGKKKADNLEVGEELLKEIKPKKEKKVKEKKVKEPKPPKEKKVKEPKAPKQPKAPKEAKTFKKPNKISVLLGKVKIGISQKLLMMCLLPMLAICVGITIFAATALRSGLEDEIEKSLQIVATSVNETYTSLYEGDYVSSQSGKVTKGDKTISGETQLIDGLKDKTGFEVSFLFGNMRLITTVRNSNGSRATGTAADSDIYKQVEQGEPVSVQDLEISTSKYYAYYQPLINSDGSVIGAIEVAMESSSVNELIRGQVVKIVLFAIIFVVIAAALVLIMSRTMVTTMKTIHTFLNKIVNGELGAEVDETQKLRNDELGDIYRITVKLQETLRKIVTDIKTSADNLTISANQLAEMSQDTKRTMDGVVISVDEISQGALAQAESSSTANDNIVLISEQIDLITQEVEQLTKHAGRMDEDEKASVQIVEELSASNEETKVSIDKVGEQITIMHDSLKGIKSAVEVIQNIADETDLLSLNASIEAARAGEAGRGFAIVAEQISKLADQSGRSATEIEKIIEEFLNISDKMVAIMGEVKVNMNHQQNKLAETQEKYKDVSKGVEDSLTNIGNIKGKVDVLSDSRNAIRDRIEDLAAISQENAASSQSTMISAQDVSETMQQLQQASEDLLKLSDVLKEGLVIFKI
ncbi:MAG: methyl-accepting chemotaxis protein [Lachnospiraceae bacterium]|nr:methyl-accepting chemotaxis protein [Lachnospiraceae bacterium]MBQ7776974.1 methyl-accepting chemotaxis protein [Lachnospiraceae bacterium]